MEADGESISAPELNERACEDILRSEQATRVNLALALTVLKGRLWRKHRLDVLLGHHDQFPLEQITRHLSQEVCEVLALFNRQPRLVVEFHDRDALHERGVLRKECAMRCEEVYTHESTGAQTQQLDLIHDVSSVNTG